MNRYHFCVGNASDRGPEALIFDDCQLIGIASLAVAGKVVAALNSSDAKLSDTDRIRRLHDILVEMYKMTAPLIASRERDQFTSKESDDSKRARQLMEQAGQIVNGAA